ncbi:MAG: hypothetical protein M1816_007145 [Peltula sp. TS41687]|nr:MAG: hypothetical protein M1816_007145 [Peltula sp. TS41687]
MALSSEDMDEESSSQIMAAASSSPCGPVSSGVQSDKPRKPPSVTPRTFRRFFTPRSMMRTRQKTMSSARRAFQDITDPANNRSRTRQREDGNVLEPFADINTGKDENTFTNVRGKRRKTLHFPELTFEGRPHSPADLSSPTTALAGGRYTNAEPLVPAYPEPLTPESLRYLGDPALDEEEDEEEEEIIEPKVIPRVQRRWQSSSVSGRLLHRELGIVSNIRRQFHPVDWHHETVHFWSGPSDFHQCRNTRIPFCVASCNTNSLVAIGDESGGVRLLDPAKDAKHSFGTLYLDFKVHSNAILDLAFSSDDLLLGTASGDQTAHVVDMPTQQTISILAGHVASMKQIRFQPGQGSNNVIATSSRDGDIHIWDLRCKGGEATMVLQGEDDESRSINHARPVKSIFEAHNDRHPAPKPGPNKSLRGGAVNTNNPPTHQRDISITSLAFLPPGKEHLLLSASEINSSIKLWDLRSTLINRRTTNHNNNIPLTTIPQPPSHTGLRRSAGITSLALNHDGSRLYSLCRDNTIYVYSSAHLILGHAPELSAQPNSNNPRSRRSVIINNSTTPKPSLGPLYGLRHAAFRSTSFYVKLSLRKPHADKPELLAVGGGTKGGPVLFPTDERYFRHPGLHRPTSRQQQQQQQQLTKQGAGTARGVVVMDEKEDIPIYTHGTPLVRGHFGDREVTSTAWSVEGELISLGDDYLVRCWREDADVARGLRLGKEGEGGRAGCGWAEFDGEEEEDEEEEDDDEDDED